MATQGERKALGFLAAVALLGAGTRACRARRPPVPGAAVEAQIAAVDSAKSLPRRLKSREPANPPTRQPVDLDIASASEIERLPGIGPALAKRIVSDREANGPYRCLVALDRVKGVGPALLERLDSLTTFSLGGGAPCVSPGQPPAAGPLR